MKEKETSARMLVQERAYLRLCTRLVSESLSCAERIHVKEFRSAILPFGRSAVPPFHPEGPIDYRSIVHYGLRRI
jgi:hypothetical protein